MAKNSIEHEPGDPLVSGEQYEPYVPDSARIPEFTLKALILGSIITIVFGVANAYLGLKAGLTVASSIPASILAAVFFKFVRKGTPLENNIIQTIGSTGYSLASGIIFTIPAFFIWGMDPGQFQIFLFALLGGILGVLMMIPLRHYLMVKEHGVLPFPEGVACAEIIISSQEAADKARYLFYGCGIGFVYALFAHPHFFGLWQSSPSFPIPGYSKAQWSVEATPELIGAGFIIGPRIGMTMLAGAVLGSLVIVPLIALVGQSDPTIAAMSAGALRSKYVRLIGAGALITGGLLSLIKGLPVIVSSMSAVMRGLTERREARANVKRTHKDLPSSIVLGGCVLIIILIALAPKSLLPVGVVGALCVALFGFIFSAVLARVVGIVGSSASPLSSMVIATLILTSSIFIALGMTSDLTAAKITIMSVGSIVCIACALALDISQDLKTGFLVGATPAKAQIAQLYSVLISAPVMAAAVYLFKRDILSGALAAPQANLMATIVDTMLKGDLSWVLLFGGIGIALTIELVGASALAFAIGLYLPMGVSVAIGIGGVIGYFVRRASHGNKNILAQREERGILMGSGYIAGGAIAGVIVTALVGASEVWQEPHAFLTWIIDITVINPDDYQPVWEPLFHGIGTFGSYFIFGLLALTLYRVARGKQK